MTLAGWFYDNGFHVFPVNGKTPAVPKGTSQFDYRCSLEEAARLANYGVPLGALAVADTDSAETEEWAAVHLPKTPFQVRTARGWHRYYRLDGDAPHYFHRDGHTIEFRHRGQYVIGPGSRHPTGTIYTATDWSWDIQDLPSFPVSRFLFDDRPPGARGTSPGEPFAFPEAVRAGERHDQLFRLLRSCKGLGWDLCTAREVVHLANQNRCEPPLLEDDAFERWFTRAWHHRDRPFTSTERPSIPDRSLEPNAATGAWDLHSPGRSL